ncbi:hypothetical protein [Marinicella sp. W31]
MKRLLLIILILMCVSCAHKPMKTTKKAPCDFESKELTAGFEDNTK